MITRIEDFFEKGCGRCARFATPECSARQWLSGLAELRRICRAAGLTETVKWGHPCYMHGGRNIVIIGAFRGDFRLSFFNAALMTDREGILERQGPNTQHPDMIRFTSADQVSVQEPLIRAYLAEAMGYAEADTKSPASRTDLDLPDEMTEALEADSGLMEAFRSLTPGRQKSYAIALASAKSPATRMARIGRFRSRIIAGKGANEL